MHAGDLEARKACFEPLGKPLGDSVAAAVDERPPAAERRSPTDRIHQLGPVHALDPVGAGVAPRPDDRHAVGNREPGTVQRPQHRRIALRRHHAGDGGDADVGSIAALDPGGDRLQGVRRRGVADRHAEDVDSPRGRSAGLQHGASMEEVTR